MLIHVRLLEAMLGPSHVEFISSQERHVPFKPLPGPKGTRRFWTMSGPSWAYMEPMPGLCWAYVDPCLTGAVEDRSQLQEDTSKFAVGSAEKQAKSKFGASF